MQLWLSNVSCKCIKVFVNKIDLSYVQICLKIRYSTRNKSYEHQTYTTTKKQVDTRHYVWTNWTSSSVILLDNDLSLNTWTVETSNCNEDFIVGMGIKTNEAKRTLIAMRTLLLVQYR